MSDETGEMPTGETEQSEVTPTIDLQKELDLTRAALKKANAEAAQRRKLLDQIEAEKKARDEAELSEIDKLRKQLEETRAKANALELAQKKAAIAAKVNLPTALADRLTGGTDEEMEADALFLLSNLPTANGKTAPQLKPTNMSAADEVKETREQRLKRLGFA